MIVHKLLRIAAVVSVCSLTVTGAIAEERGTMNLMPSSSIAVALSDTELSTKRGGFLGVSFSATFTASVENLNTNLTGSGSSSSSTSGVTNTNPPTTYNVQNGQATLSTFVGNLSNVSGVFNIVQVPGSFNVVNSSLTVQVAIVNVTNGSAVPTLNTIFGR
jgi:hypothetical protein